MSHPVRGRSRLAAVLGAAALAAFAVFGGGGAASATETPTGPGPNIDPDTKGSLTIHKLASPVDDPELPNNGTEIGDIGDLQRLGGVTFTITPVTGIDLTTNAGWDQATALSDAVRDGGSSAVPPGSRGTPVRTVTTESDPASPDFGTATQGNLPLGVYLVEETGLGDNGIVTPAAPFIVTIPLPTTVGSGGAAQQTWLTDVHVYPKNAVSNVDKTVDDSSALGLGDTVTWTIQGAIPPSFGTEALTSYSLEDQLDSRLTFVPGSVEASIVPAGGGAPIPLTAEGATPDFTVTGPGAGPGGTAVFALTAAGLVKAQANPGGHYAVTFDTRVTGVGDGTIVNRGIANINDVRLTSQPVQTQWGVLKIFKYDAATANDPQPAGLEGAKFRIYTQETGGTPVSVTVGQDGSGADIRADEFTSGADGWVTIPGLKVGTYWIEETQAPDRYQPHQGRIKVEITAETTMEAGKPVLVPVTVEVPNVKIPDWQLPLTGGAGLLAPMIGFALLIGAAGAALLVRKRGATR